MLSYGLIFSQLAKLYLGTMSERLSALEIDRFFYPLILISEAENSICQKDLAQKLMVDNVTMVRIIDYLSEAGYLKRVKSKTDRRMHMLVITDKAERHILEIKAAYKEINSICFKNFNKEEKGMFHSLLLQVKSNLINHPRREFKINFKKINK